jgi:hypothetical protein
VIPCRLRGPRDPARECVDGELNPALPLRFAPLKERIGPKIARDCG